MKKYIFLLLLLFLNKIYSQNISYNKNSTIDFTSSLIDNKLKSKKVVKKINELEKLEGVYLGQIKTKSNEIYHIVTLVYLFNLKNSPTAENHIFFFNKDKLYYGYYYLNYIFEIPNKLEKNKLFFENKFCNKKNVIDFSYGIVKTINLKCNNENNYYEFQK